MHAPVHPADPEVVDEQGWTALVIASAGGHKALASRLLEGGASVATRSKSSGRTALMAAAQADRVAVLHGLLEADGCDEALLNAADAAGSTALMLAARSGHAAAVRALLDARADPYAVDGSGVSALELAARKGSEEAVGLLLDAGSSSGSSHDAAAAGGGEGGGKAPAMQVAKAMMLAAKHGHSPCVALLMKAGAPTQHLLIRVAARRTSSAAAAARPSPSRPDRIGFGRVHGRVEGIP